MNRAMPRYQARVSDISETFIPLHVLHAASKEPVDASQLAGRLAHRGFKVDRQSLMALLLNFERKGWLVARKPKNGAEPIFQITGDGQGAIEEAKPLVSSLFRQVS